MGYLAQLIKENLNNTNSAELYKNNTVSLYDSYSKSSKEITSIPISNIKKGGFYFFQYLDDSNWMQYSPVFVADYKKVNDLIIVFALNFNFIPLNIRISIFDKFIKKEDIEKNSLLPVDYPGLYKVLSSVGFEYALVEYNLKQIKTAHHINMSEITSFLYGGHPINKYDPNKLYDIWSKKIKTRDIREQELITFVVNGLQDISKNLSNEYDVLSSHIKKLQKSINKYGK